jgi:hypothetical protein
MTVSASEVAASDSRIARRACAELQATATASRPMSDLGLVDPTSVPVPERQVTDEASPHRHHRRLRDSRGRRPRGRRSHAEHLARARTGKTDARQTKSRRRRPSRWPMSRPAFCRSWSPASCATGWLGRRSSWSPLTRASLPEHDHRRTHLALAASHSTRRRSRRSSVAGAWILRRSTESAPRGPVTLAPWVGRRSGRETRCSRRWWPEASTLLSARSTTRRGWAHHPRAVCLLCAARRKSAPLRAYSRGRGGWGVGPIAIFMEWGCPTDRAMGPGGQGSHRHTRPVGPASTREGTSRGALATTMSRTRRSLRASKQRSRGSSERSRICEEQV